MQHGVFTCLTASVRYLFIGYIGQKAIGFDIHTLSSMSLYLMSPFLAFETFYQNKVSMDYVYLSIFVVGLCLSLVLCVFILSRIYGYSNEMYCAMILSSAFMNNGNYGTPVVLLVFGAAGLDIAIVLMVLQQLVMSTIGMYYAAKGGEDAGDGKVVLKKCCVCRLHMGHSSVYYFSCLIFHYLKR